MITITPSTVEAVSKLFAEENASQLRIFVQGGGCSGFSYGFAFDDTTAEDDFVIDQYGIKFVVDSMSMQYLQGAEIDYQETFDGAMFVIKNPNAETTCGCGSSFSV